MRITDTDIIERGTPEGGHDYICDSGIGKSYHYRLAIYCKRKRASLPFSVFVYFNDDMSVELYDAICDCIGNIFFRDMYRLGTKIYNLLLSEAQLIGSERMMDYINKYTTSEKDFEYATRICYHKLLFRK